MPGCQLCHVRLNTPVQGLNSHVTPIPFAVEASTLPYGVPQAFPAPKKSITASQRFCMVRWCRISVGQKIHAERSSNGCAGCPPHWLSTLSAHQMAFQAIISALWLDKVVIYSGHQHFWVGADRQPRLVPRDDKAAVRRIHVATRGSVSSRDRRGSRNPRFPSNISTNQAVSAPVLKRKTTSRKDEGLLTELYRQEIDLVLAGLKGPSTSTLYKRGSRPSWPCFLPIPQQIELRQHLFVMVLKLPVEETKKTISDTTLDLNERGSSKDGPPIAQHDHGKTNEKNEGIHLRLDVVDIHAIDLKQRELTRLLALGNELFVVHRKS